MARAGTLDWALLSQSGNVPVLGSFPCCDQLQAGPIQLRACAHCHPISHHPSRTVHSHPASYSACSPSSLPFHSPPWPPTASSLSSPPSSAGSISSPGAFPSIPRGCSTGAGAPPREPPSTFTSSTFSVRRLFPTQPNPAQPSPAQPSHAHPTPCWLLAPMT